MKRALSSWTKDNDKTRCPCGNPKRGYQDICGDCFKTLPSEVKLLWESAGVTKGSSVRKRALELFREHAASRKSKGVKA